MHNIQLFFKKRIKSANLHAVIMRNGFLIVSVLLLCVFHNLSAQPLMMPDGGPRNHFTGGYMWQKLLLPSSSYSLKAADGERALKILVIPAQYKDVSFFYTRDHFVKMLSADNYTDFEAEGSARIYLEKQFGCKVDITVSEIVTVKENRSYYGKNDTRGNDSHPGTFVAEACQAAAQTVDFSEFDSDGDGFVDNVFVFFAGEDEAQCSKEHPDYMWSHSYNLKNSDYGKTLTLNEVQVNNYACSSELYRRYASATDYEDKMAPIGTFCHEYLHNFGVADLYDTDYEKSGGIAAGVWGVTSLMSSGNYNNFGNTPANLNALERECLGILEPEEMSEGDYVVYPIGNEKCVTYSIHNPENDSEYYLFEVRSLDSWDRFIGIDEEYGVGMLVYHVDKSEGIKSDSETFGSVSSKDRWTKYNEVNANPAHQCADLIEADGRSDLNPSESAKKDIRGIYFPGIGASAIGGEAKTKLTFWDGTTSKYALRNIRIDAGTIRFTCVDLLSPFPVPPVDPPKDDDMLYIIVLVNPDGSLSMRVNNSIGGIVEYYYEGSLIDDPANFKPAASGTVMAEVTWEDGSVDHLFKEHTVK